MFDYTDKNNVLNGVSCSAVNCVYHSSGNMCHAPGIAVGTDNADKKSETLCSTFECCK
ncbi:MAG: DUF1540 domain-containing protein [Oscillospiraceae bacterium]|nr:DUF1540 domain-containing protein [Oscillospiraceae bacterium]